MKSIISAHVFLFFLISVSIEFCIFTVVSLRCAGSILFQVSRHTDIITDFIAVDHLDMFMTCSMDKRIGELTSFIFYLAVGNVNVVILSVFKTPADSV